MEQGNKWDKIANNIRQMLESRRLIHQDIQLRLTNLGISSDALGGSPAPSTIQGFSEDPLVFGPEVIISLNLACNHPKLVRIQRS